MLFASLPLLLAVCLNVFRGVERCLCVFVIRRSHSIDSVTQNLLSEELSHKQATIKPITLHPNWPVLEIYLPDELSPKDTCPNYQE